jgi:hypothetical protein
MRQEEVRLSEVGIRSIGDGAGGHHSQQAMTGTDGQTMEPVDRISLCTGLHVHRYE